MADIQTHLKKIRSDAAECLVLSSLASDGKREVFIRIAEHLNTLALELETSIRVATNTAGVPKNEEISVINAPPRAGARQVGTPRRILPWMLVIIFGAIAAAVIWTNNPAEKYRAFMQWQRGLPPQENSDRAFAESLVSGEQAERKLLSDRVAAIAGRLDDIANSLDSLKKARAETADTASTGSVGSEAKLPAAENASPSPTEKPVATADNRPAPVESPTALNSASLNQSDAVGPRGCSQFRSFDARSGTYVTLDGRRRPCR
jgi:BA14K-like protein